jgi:hypothetical protein
MLDASPQRSAKSTSMSGIDALQIETLEEQVMPADRCR